MILYFQSEFIPRALILTKFQNPLQISQPIGTVIALSIVSALLIVALYICSLPFSGQKQRDTNIAFPTGEAIIDARFGWAVCCKFIFTILSALISAFATYQLGVFICQQSYSYSNPKLANLTALIFTENASDPIVHTNWQPNANVTSEFTNDTLSLQVDNFTTYGRPIYIRLFFALNVTQMTQVGDWLEFGFNTSDENQFQINCNLSTSTNFTYSSAPKIQYYDVDVNIYKQKYFNSSGMYSINCTQLKYKDTKQPVKISIVLNQIVGKLALNDQIALLLGILFLVFGIVMFSIIFGCLNQCSGSLILRRADERVRRGG